jgi:hypothetical protein
MKGYDAVQGQVGQTHDQSGETLNQRMFRGFPKPNG